MKKSDRTISLICFAFSLVVAIESYRLGLGGIFSPKAGFFPFVISTIFGILSLTLFILALKSKYKIPGKGKDIIFNRQMLPKVLSVAASMFIYAILLNTFGFILTTMIFIGFLLIIKEPQKWYVVITGAISVPLIGYLIFDVFLKVQLPKGFLGF